MQVRMLHDVLVGETHYQAGQVYDIANGEHYVAEGWAEAARGEESDDHKAAVVWPTHPGLMPIEAEE